MNLLHRFRYGDEPLSLVDGWQPKDRTVLKFVYEVWMFRDGGSYEIDPTWSELVDDAASSVALVYLDRWSLFIEAGRVFRNPPLLNRLFRRSALHQHWPFLSQADHRTTEAQTARRLRLVP